MSRKIQQEFNDGLVNIYTVENAAEKGDKPREVLRLRESLRYKERTVGLTRFYTAMQAQITVKLLLRCPLRRSVHTQDIAIPNDGRQYRIRQVQIPEDVTPPVMDLTLEEVETIYEIDGSS